MPSGQARLDWLRLYRTEGIGPVGFRQLVARFGSAAAALDALPGLAVRGGRRAPLRLCSVAEADRELAWHEAQGARLVMAGDPDYPPLLAAVDDAPPVFTALGRLALLARPTVALVGARNASLNGRRFAEAMAAGLARAGLTVVSGLARGIDGAAHLGALDLAAGDGGTVAVLGGGADVVYPREHAQLQAEIAERGLLIAESPPGTVPQAHHFPRRNRIIAGLSLGVVVVEAAVASGSLITARLAAEQGREVMAVPGSPLDPRSRGANRLLKDGAHLVESAEDVLAILLALPLARSGPAPIDPAPVDQAPVDPAPPVAAAGTDDLDAARVKIADELNSHPVAVDELVRRCHFSAAVVATVLLELELAGRLERHPGNRVSRLA